MHGDSGRRLRLVFSQVKPKTTDRPVGKAGPSRYNRRVTQRILRLTGILAVTTVALAAQEIGSTDIAVGLANPARWLTYSGDYSGKRHSPLKEITPANAGRLAARWTFQTGIPGKFEATPIVIDGTLYVTGPENTAWAIDGRTGKQVWRHQRQLPKDLRVCCGNVNRGFAVHGTRLFMTTLDAHLVALDLKTGAVQFDVPIADYTLGYAATVAPLVVRDKVIVGISGGEFGIRGFIDAYDPQTGKQIWRFWTVPGIGEPGSETWPPDVWARGGGPTWQTGSYDPELNLIYWGTGNPSPDFYGDERKGDNLYTGSLVALDADTGKLRWHFQFTPHDTHDWDANHVPVIADITIGGRQRQVVMVANRNGFFYVLDRATGEFLLGKPYIKQTWAKGIDAKGRPLVILESEPSEKGSFACPDLFGGTNFMPPSFDPATGLFYVSARETCMTYFSRDEEFKPGGRWMGGTMKFEPQPRSGALRAIDPATGEVKWEIKHDTPPWAGVLSTAGGVVFTGNSEGHFIAADSRTGKELYRYPLGAVVYAAPTTLLIDGKQYVVLPAGYTLTAFALP